MRRSRKATGLMKTAGLPVSGHPALFFLDGARGWGLFVSGKSRKSTKRNMRIRAVKAAVKVTGILLAAIFTRNLVKGGEKMKKRVCRLVVLVSLLGLVAAPGWAASFSVDVGSSFFFGQRGAGIEIDSSYSGTDFGHLVGTIGAAGGEMIGTGSAEAEVGGEMLDHRISVDPAYEIPQCAHIELAAYLAVDGEAFNNVVVTNNNWNNYSYADASTTTVFTINPGSGEAVGQSVLVNVEASAFSDEGGLFDKETGLGGGFPHNFRVLHNSEVVYEADNPVFSPDDSILDGLVINALIGDTIAIDAAVWAHLLGNEMVDGYFEGYAEIECLVDLSVESNPVPIPGALWLLGSGLFGLVALRRRKKES